MGPDSNKMLKPGYKSLYKHAGRVVYENKERETDLKSTDEGKEDHGRSQQIKLNNFAVSLWDKRREVLYPISILIYYILSESFKVQGVSHLIWRTITQDMQINFSQIGEAFGSTKKNFVYCSCLDLCKLDYGYHNQSCFHLYYQLEWFLAVMHLAWVMRKKYKFFDIKISKSLEKKKKRSGKDQTRLL